VRRAVLSVGRKNGKTALIAALVLCHLCGPESISNGEIYSAANEREQAAIVFKMAAQLVRAEPYLESLLRVVDSTKTIAYYSNGSVYRALSAEAGSKHGLNPSFLIYDELAQAKNRELYDVLDTSQGARAEPLFITISTQNPDPEHILSQLIDDGLRSEDPTTVTHLYAVKDDAENIFDESVWYDANPALGDFRSLEDMRAQANKAQRMPSFETAFRNLYLNQRIDAASPLIPKAEWLACQAAEPLLGGDAVYLGLDLSTTNDLTALVAVSAEDGDRVGAWFWKPGDLLKEHEDRDRAPYVKWHRDGWLEAPEGRSIQYEFVASRIAQLSGEYEVLGLAFDRWRMEYLLPHLASAGLDPRKDTDRAGGLRMVPWGQGWKDMAPAIDALESAILERTFKHPGNPVLTYCFANAQAITDPAGNRKLDKSKSRFRIDGAVACAMAIGLKSRDQGDEGPSVYEERGILTL
jgi:phage terminase large subunit-like protein